MIQFPAQYKGMEDSLPPEMKKPFLELIRRLTINTNIATQAATEATSELDEASAFNLHWGV